MIFWLLYPSVSFYLYQQWMPRLVKLEPTWIPLDAVPVLAAFLFAFLVAAVAGV